MPIAYDMNEAENESYIDGVYKINTCDTIQEWNLAFVFCYKRGHCFTETVYHFHYVVKRYQLL